MLTSAVQLGFISGTLLFAILSIADRFSPSKVFFVSALIAALFNIAVITLWSFPFLLSFRFVTGFFLAGIYPVGMKIASDYFQKGLGVTLGFLVGALVLGTAFPHLLRAYSSGIAWESVILATSVLSVLGGLIIFLFVPDGPYRSSSTAFDPGLVFRLFKNKAFRQAAFGYFGHMWELYSFWAFVPLMIAAFFTQSDMGYSSFTISFYSFSVIASGSIACALAGHLSVRYKVLSIAKTALYISGFCCLFYPIVLLWGGFHLFITFMFLWGMSVVADSPMFSTLIAQAAPDENRATALTIVNSIGFAITILSMSTLALIMFWLPLEWAVVLLLSGPIVSIASLTGQQSKAINP